MAQKNDGMAKSMDPRYNGGIAAAPKKKSGSKKRGGGRGGGGGGRGRGRGGGRGDRRDSKGGRGGGGKGRGKGGKGGKGKGCYHCGGRHNRADCPELEPELPPPPVKLVFKDEAAYKAFLAKCDAERKASEDIAFRNHGEYIKYLTKIKEKEDDAHAAWKIVSDELEKKAQAIADLAAIDAALAKSRLNAPKPPPAAPKPPTAPATPKPAAPAPNAFVNTAASGAAKLAASPFSSAWGDSSDDD